MKGGYRQLYVDHVMWSTGERISISSSDAAVRRFRGNRINAKSSRNGARVAASFSCSFLAGSFGRGTMMKQ
jgi:hypothetical protein